MATKLNRDVKFKFDMEKNTIEIIADWTPVDNHVEIELGAAENKDVLFLKDGIISVIKPEKRHIRLVNSSRNATIIYDVGFAGTYSYKIHSNGEELESGLYSFRSKSSLKINLCANPYGKNKDGITQLIVESDYKFPMTLFSLAFNLKIVNTVLTFPLPEMSYDTKRKKYVSVCYVYSDYKNYGKYKLMLCNDSIKDYVQINNKL